MDNRPKTPIFHEGYALKCFIAEGYVSANEVGQILGISKTAVYGLFGAEKLEKKYVDILLKNKLKIVGLTTNKDAPNVSNGGVEPNNPHSEAIESLKDKLIEQQAEEIQVLKDYIVLLKRQVNLDAPLRKS